MAVYFLQKNENKTRLLYPIQTASGTRPRTGNAKAPWLFHHRQSLEEYGKKKP